MGAQILAWASSKGYAISEVDGTLTWSLSPMSMDKQQPSFNDKLKPNDLYFKVMKIGLQYAHTNLTTRKLILWFHIFIVFANQEVSLYHFYHIEKLCFLKKFLIILKNDGCKSNDTHHASRGRFDF